MKLIERIERLEQKMQTKLLPRIKINRFIISPDNLHPDRFECNGEVFTQQPDECHNDFMARCSNTATWQDGEIRKIFQ